MKVVLIGALVAVLAIFTARHLAMRLLAALARTPLRPALTAAPAHPDTRPAQPATTGASPAAPSDADRSVPQRNETPTPGPPAASRQR